MKYFWAKYLWPILQQCRLPNYQLTSFTKFRHEYENCLEFKTNIQGPQIWIEKRTETLYQNYRAMVQIKKKTGN